VTTDDAADQIKTSLCRRERCGSMAYTMHRVDKTDSLSRECKCGNNTELALNAMKLHKK